MNLLRAYIFSILLAFVTPTYSGVRVILNGGGSAEMLALRILHSLDGTLKQATVMAGPLGLNSEEYQLLEDINTNMAISSKSVVLKFLDTQDVDIVNYDMSDVNQLEISYLSFYNENKTPKNTSEIAVIVAKAWLSHPRLYKNKKLVLDSLLNKSLRILNAKTQSVKGENGIKLIENKIYLSGNYVTSALTLESDQGVLDLNGIVENSLPCEKGTPKFLKSDNISATGEYFVLNVEFLCGKSLYSSLLSLKNPMTINLSSQDQLKLIFKQKKLISENCVDILSGDKK